MRWFRQRQATAGSLSATQHFDEALEIVVRLEGQHDVPLILAADTDLHSGTELLPQLVLDTLHVRCFLGNSVAVAMAVFTAAFRARLGFRGELFHESLCGVD